MLFDRILDFMNLDNRKKRKYCTEYPSLKSIKQFWKLHPQTYINASPENIDSEICLLYAKTLILWAFGNCSPLRSSDGYPVYFRTECKLSNPRKLHINLINDGFLATPSAFEIFSKYKLADLKTIADSIGCKKGGSKAELVHRILDNIDAETLQTHIDYCTYYSLTPKGHAFLNANYDLVEFHRHIAYDISLVDFFKNRFAGNKRRSFADNAFQILSSRVYTKILYHYYYMIEFDYMCLHEITLSEHRYDIALDCYLKSLYLKTCLIHEVGYFNHDWETSWEDFDSIIVLTTRTAADFINLSSFYTPVFVDNIYKDASMPPSFLSCSEFKNLINDMAEQTIFDYEKYNILLRNRLRKYAKL